MTDQVEPAAASAVAIVPLPQDPPPATSVPREYRKGNWTLHETLILITAKKMDDERRTRTGGRTAELRWKWVENFCWKNGCMRSQNQCNDKWDNLLRDYKKVRDYETCRLPDQSGADHRPSSSSYWNMERNERKEKNLPSNLTVEIFQALHEVVNRRNSPRITAALPVSSALPAEERQHVPSVQVAVADTMLPPPPPPPPPPRSPPPLSGNEMSNSSESSTDDEEDMDSDHNLGKRKMRSSSSSLSSSILQSASIISQTLLACEEKKEKRHRENLEMEEKRLQVEEHRNEMSRQGLANLISAVNNLSNAINSIISDRK